MHWSWQFTWSILPQLLHGLRETVILTLISAALAVGVGFFIEMSRRIPYIGFLFSALGHLLRGTPLLIQLYVLFYLLPYAGLLISGFWAAVCGLCLNVGAYIAEDLRGGIESVPRGQYDAAIALNLSRLTTWFRIILPQAVRTSLPAIGNEINLTFKLSAMAYVITVNELFFEALNIGSESFRYVEPLTLVGVFYLVVSVPVSIFIRHLARRSSGTAVRPRSPRPNVLITTETEAL